MSSMALTGRRPSFAVPSGGIEASAHHFSVAVAGQAEAAYSDPLWKAVKEGDEVTAMRIVHANPRELEKTGKAGESILHWCYLHNRPIHQQLAQNFLALRPSLVYSTYNSADYAGENCLHLAIAHNDVRLVRELIARAPELVHGKASGSFFRRSGKAYLGELPLSFAASLNRGQIARLLVERGGALISAPDSEGNTALHMCAYHKRKEMFDLLEELWARDKGRPPQFKHQSLRGFCNIAGQCPIVVAAACGHKEMFQHMWDRQREHLWTWGHVTAYLYPLDLIDHMAFVVSDEPDSVISAEANEVVDKSRSIQKHKQGRRVHTISALDSHRGHTIEAHHNAVTALDVIIKGNSESILMLETMLTLLNSKWEKYGYAFFTVRLVYSMLYLMAFTLMAVYRSGMPDDRVAFTCTPEADPRQCRNSVICEYLVLLGTVVKALFGLQRLVRVGIYRYFIDSPGAMRMEQVLSVLLWMSVFIGFIVDREVGRDASRVPFSIGAIVGWAYMLWFLLGFRLTGPFVIILYNMLLGDVVRFVTLLIIVMLGFTQAFVFLQAGNGVEGGDSFAVALRMLVNKLFQPELEPASEEDRYLLLPTLAYCFLAPIILLNLLVAQFNGTFSRIMESSEHRWQLERARIIIAMESDLPRCIKVSKYCKYWATAKDNRPYFVTEDNNMDQLEAPHLVAEVQKCLNEVMKPSRSSVATSWDSDSDDQDCRPVRTFVSGDSLQMDDVVGVVYSPVKPSSAPPAIARLASVNTASQSDEEVLGPEQVKLIDESNNTVQAGNDESSND